MLPTKMPQPMMRHTSPVLATTMPITSAPTSASTRPVPWVSALTSSYSLERYQAGYCGVAAAWQTSLLGRAYDAFDKLAIFGLAVRRCLRVGIGRAFKAVFDM